MNIETLSKVPHKEQSKIANRLVYGLNGEDLSYVKLVQKFNQNPLLLAVIAGNSPDLDIQIPHGFAQWNPNNSNHLLDYYKAHYLPEVNGDPRFVSIMDESEQAYTLFDIVKRDDLAPVYNIELGEAYAEGLASAKLYQECFNQSLSESGYVIEEGTNDFLFLKDQYFVSNTTGTKGVIVKDSRLPEALAFDMTFYDTAEERDADYPDDDTKASDQWLRENVGKAEAYAPLTQKQMEEGLSRLMKAIGQQPVFNNHNRNNGTNRTGY